MMGNKLVALVTGCSSGIGRHLVLELVANGYKVYAGVRNPAQLSDLSIDNVTPIVLDVTNEDHIKAAVSLISDKEGKINLIINNAGYGLMGPLIDIPMHSFQDQLTTNLIAPLALTQAFFSLLKSSKPSLIVNIGSVSGDLATPFAGAYSASKAGIHLLTETLRMELSPFGIDVMLVKPSQIESSFAKNASSLLSGNINANSNYSRFSGAINSRAHASQTNPMPSCQFSRSLVREIIQHPQKGNINIGKNRFLFFAMQYLLPPKIKERVLRKKFGLLEI